jgi:hypothetical protein
MEILNSHHLRSWKSSAGAIKSSINSSDLIVINSHVHQNSYLDFPITVVIFLNRCDFPAEISVRKFSAENIDQKILGCTIHLAQYVIVTINSGTVELDPLFNMNMYTMRRDLCIFSLWRLSLYVWMTRKRWNNCYFWNRNNNDATKHKFDVSKQWE